MIVKGIRNMFLCTLLLLILSGNGGCMGMAHHTLGGAEPAFVPSSSAENSASVEGGERAGHVPRKSERADSSFLAPHKAMMGQGSPWSWFAGAGMILMMVLIL